MGAKEEAHKSSMIETPWERATGNQRSRRQEKSLANEPGGRAQPNSGRTTLGHHDVRLNGYLIEARTTEKDSYSVKRAEFEKIEQHAISTPPGQLPAMQIDFERRDGTTMRLFVQRLEDHLYDKQRIAILEAELREARSGQQESG